MSLSPFPRANCSQLRAYLLASSVALSCALGSAPSIAGPLVIEEVAKLTSPDSTFEFGRPVAVGGNSVIVGGVRPLLPPSPIANRRQMVAFLFERNSSGGWDFVRTLGQLEDCDDPSCDRGFAIAMNSLVAAMVSGSGRVFERTTAGWVESPSLVGAQNGGLAVHSGMILVGGIEGTCSDGLMFQKQAGVWTLTNVFRRVIPPDIDTCADIDPEGGEVDLSSNRVIVSGTGQLAFGEVQIWNRNSDGSWPQPPSAIVPLPGPLFVSSDQTGRFVTIEGDHAIANSASRLLGPHHLRRDGNWAVVGNLQRPDRAMLSPPTGMDLLNGIAAIGYDDGSIAVFQRNAAGTFDYVARLVASDGFLVGKPAISGRRIVASGIDLGVCCEGTPVAYVFDLPASFSQPDLIQDDFEDRNVTEWTPIPGSAVSVPFNGLSAFYRQSSLAGDAGGLRTGVDMRNQSIEAEVVARAFAAGTGDRWFGLSVRQIDSDNLYYLTLRNTNVISLRKRVNGRVTVLATQSEFVQLKRRYKLRLEAIGSRIRAYVDGRLFLEATDRSLRHGTPGLRMFRTATDYDNVVISPNPQMTLLFDPFPFPGSSIQWWVRRPAGGAWTEVPDGSELVFMQANISANARIVTAMDAGDQVIQVRARATQFAAGDRWFGVIARSQDDQNYYFLTVRSSNTVSLRKFVNGSVIVLDTATFPVSVGTWYTLRLEAVGNSIRGYVDNRPLVEAIDDDFAVGTYGLATLQTAAQFDDFRVTQP